MNKTDNTLARVDPKKKGTNNQFRNEKKETLLQMLYS